MEPGIIVLIVVVALIVLVIARAIKIIPQARAAVIERLGRYSRTLTPGIHFLVPFVDRTRSSIDVREQVVPFPPQPVITKDNLMVGIDTVIYYQITEPRLATYGIADLGGALEQLTVTTLRNARLRGASWIPEPAGELNRGPVWTTESLEGIEERVRPPGRPRTR